MRTLRHISCTFLTLMAALALLTAPAHAFSQRVSAPVKRAGVTVGTASGTLVVAANGWAVVGVKVTSFSAPIANRSWRTRTTLKTGCTEPGFDPSEDDPADFAATPVNASSAWRTTRITGSTGTLVTSDLVKECPSGQVPGSSLVLALAVQDAAGTTNVGVARLFAAG
ncbi:MAG: hypothetical protein JWP31_485 [Aeromicrobium sp.]|nr:hypothetical protein [Aeromicrobium sp.]